MKDPSYSVKLCASLGKKEFKSVSNLCQYVVYNGNRNSGHPNLAVRRQLSIVDIIVAEPHLVDLQGKARYLGLRSKRDSKTQIPYPHCCRTAITPEDSGKETECSLSGLGHCDELGNATATFSVDVLQRVNASVIANFCLMVRSRTHYAVFLDNRIASKEVTRQTTTKGILSTIPGKGSTLDQYLAWLGPRATTVKLGTTQILLTWEQFGTTYAPMTTYKFTASEVTERLPITLSTVREVFVQAYRAGTFQNAYVELKNGWAGAYPEFLAVCIDGETRIYNRREFERICVATRHRTVDKRLEESLRFYLKSETFPSHPDIIHKVLNAKVIVEQEIEEGELPVDKTIYKEEAAPWYTSVTSWIPSLKSVSDFMRSAPTFFKLLPFGSLGLAASPFKCDTEDEKFYFKATVACAGLLSIGVAWYVYSTWTRTEPPPRITLAEAREGREGHIVAGESGYEIPRGHELKPIRAGAEISQRPESRPYSRVDLHPNLIVVAGCVPHTQAQTPNNLYVGLRNRYLAEARAPADGWWKACAQHTRDWIVPGQIEWTTYSEWDERYEPHKRVKHAKSWLLWDGTLEGIDFTRHVFLKKEKNDSVTGLLATLREPKLKDPRIISADRDGVVDVLIGPAIYSITKELCKQWHQGARIFLASGITSVDLCNWYNSSTRDTHRRDIWRMAVLGDDNVTVVGTRAGHKGVSIDFARYDLNIPDEAHEMELETHVSFAAYPNPYVDLPAPLEEVLEVCERGVWNAPFSNDQHKIEGFKRGGRNSGDQHTTCGNSEINGRAVGFALDQTVHILWNGDVPGFKLALQAILDDSGMKAEIQVTDVDETEFLSGFFIPINGTFWWVPKPGRFLARIGTTTSHPLSVAELRSTLLQFINLTNVPFIGDYVTHCLNLLGVGETVEVERRQVAITSMVPCPGPDTWAWFAKRYGLGPADAATFRRELETVQSLPWSLESGVAMTLVSKDYF